MATIINTPRSSEDSGGAGIILGELLALILAGLFVFFGLPALRQNQTPTPADTIDVNVQVPTPTASTETPITQPDTNQP